MSIHTDLITFNNIPLDVLFIVFKNLKLEIDTVSLVCNKWKEIVDSEEFREMIRPPRAMGIKQLIDQNPNITFEGKEHPLPRKFYKEYAEKGGLCFFNPGRVKLKKANGEYQLVVLNSLEAIASLFPNPNLKTRFTDDSWQQALKKIREEEAPHWVWEEAKVYGFNKTPAEQQAMVEEEDKALYPERYQATEENSAIVSSQDKPKASKPKQIVVMSNANDHVLGKFMAEAVLGEREVTWDKNSGKLGYIRVNNTIRAEANGETPVIVAVALSGLLVHFIYDRPSVSSVSSGVVCARKSFST